MASSPHRELGSDEQAEAKRIATPDTITPAGPQTLTLGSPELYINRELSLLEFQKRVLQEAQDPENPLLERVKFLSIVSSNLDEFFMVRVAGLQKQAASGTQEASVDGLPAAIQLQRIREEVRRLVQVIQDLLRDTLLPGLQSEGIRILDISSLTAEERSAMDSYFLETVFPVLTPLAFDPGRPFPHISSGSLNLAVVVGDHQGTENFARVKVPDSLPRLVLVETDRKRRKAQPRPRPGFAPVGRADHRQFASAVSGNGNRRSTPFPRNSRRRGRHSRTGERRPLGKRRRGHEAAAVYLRRAATGGRKGFRQDSRDPGQQFAGR